MRLEKIKLAGFKSFVDPTVVQLPSNLVGVVGPNGCGKSNVIDAVRWVMGESSARSLRGESMADVIFNGSSARKPVGMASIELLFDNSDGGAGGQYASYNQITVKRQIARDGQSGYFLNGSRCRRRDITDLFLGTGLGPRSYSIIEQGTISRLVEARPEELRQFLEEAAGISRYKERRRETENRIQHTRENLDRLNDLREEIGKHLLHLERQAATAERYQEFRVKERRLKAELLALRWRALDQELERQESARAGLEVALEAAVADQRANEARLEQVREQTHDAGDRFNQVQGRYYGVGADIARMEQTLQFQRESARRQQREIEQLDQSLAAAARQRDQDAEELTRVAASLADQEPRLELARAEEEEWVLQLDGADDAMHAWQQEWEDFNHRAAQPAQQAQVERTRITHQEQQEQQLTRRLERLGAELAQLSQPRLEEELAELEIREQALAEEGDDAQARLDQTAQDIQNLRGALADDGRRLDSVKQRLQARLGRRASLETLQQAAFQDQDRTRQGWLKEQGLDQARHLADQLRVASPWGRAVETVLGTQVGALCTDSLDRHREALPRLKDCPLNLFDTGAWFGAGAKPDPAGLQAQVQAPWPLAGLLAGIGTAANLDEALARRRALAAGESLVTPEGAWIGPDWLRWPGPDQDGAGVLERAQELRDLELELTALEEEAAALEESHQSRRQALEQAEERRARQQGELDQVNRQLHRARGELSGKRARDEQLRQRARAVHDERQEIHGQIDAGREALLQAQERLHGALVEVETLAERRESLVAQRDQLRTRLAELRDQARAKAAEVRRLELGVEGARNARGALLQGLGRLDAQAAEIRARRDGLWQALGAAEEPVREAQAELDQQLARRLELERELAAAREALESLDAEMRKFEQGRLKAEQEVTRRREALANARLGLQESKVRADGLAEQLAETGLDTPDLFAGLSEDATEPAWQTQLDAIAARIQRLGPINLAAIDEFHQQRERKSYLDAQHEDVTRSLETLEEAIRKIDRETRTRFKETFDKVNQGLQVLFPRLFGGGHAYLELTGENLLDAGVSLMARPPGKRNSSIQLLSGGEKALTAVALVFAIFQLNPAPFCMLDEVDAPLDDANVGRFCELVKSLSDQVQFIFITHNKVTMALAHQLTGVTMHEPGVSRLVSVDVAEAVQWAAV